jgi:hypothetical protein
VESLPLRILREHLPQIDTSDLAFVRSRRTVQMIFASWIPENRVAGYLRGKAFWMIVIPVYALSFPFDLPVGKVLGSNVFIRQETPRLK